LGIKDIKTPDWGEAQVFEEGEVPVFWVGCTSSCGCMRWANDVGVWCDAAVGG
jgi:uncharacterized protein YcsI (UPF0317 family)